MDAAELSMMIRRLLWQEKQESVRVELIGKAGISTAVNSPDGFATGDNVGVTGTVKMVRHGGGTIELTIKKGIITEIEDEAE